MSISRSVGLSLATAIMLGGTALSVAHAAPFMIVGNDEKVLWDDAGKTVLKPAGKDSVLIVDLANPENPKIVANLPLENSVVGPPVNVDIDPTGSVALVSDSVDVTKDGDALKMGLDNKIYVIDLKAKPAKLAATITGGKQPSGLSFSPDGKMALVANRGDNSITVLSVNGTDVKVTDTVAMGDSVAHVAFAPDGRYVYASLNAENAVAKVDVATRALVSKVNVGIGPIQVFVTLDNRYLLTANQGTKDNPSTTVSIIDTASFAVVKTVDTGKGAHGVTVDPSGRHAYITNIYGNDVAVLDLAEQRVVATIPVDAGPNGISFAPGAPAQAPASEVILPVPHQEDESMPEMEH